MNCVVVLYFLFLFKLMNADHQLNCGDWDSYKDEYCYKVIERPKSFHDAKNACFDLDESSLVSIRSQDEQDFLFSLLKNDYNITYDVWIGIEYKINEFLWTDYSSLKYTNWANNFPVNESGYDCVQMMVNLPYNGKWTNVLCNDARNYFVCQKKQIWMFDYLQKIVMEYRETVNRLTNKLNQLTEKNSELSPTGTIAYFANTTAPFGWLKANGQTVSRITYDKLFATIGTNFGSGDSITTFNLPDLRSEFIRGWGDGRDVDKDRIFGSYQLGSSIPFVDGIEGNGAFAMSTGNLGHWNFVGSTFDEGILRVLTSGQTQSGITLPNDRTVHYTATQNIGKVTHWNIYSGSRPRNIALLACIKY